MKHRHHLLAVALLLALTGCGSGKPAATPSGAAAASTPAAVSPPATRTPPVPSPPAGGPSATGLSTGPSATGAKPSPPKPSAPGTASPTGWVPTSAAYPDVCRSALPPQARDTLGLIAKGGPYPYRSDGIVFENREGRLPKEGSGYYHEYTVVTPGAQTRGTRRIVTGSAGQQYWTDDHYDSFAEVDSRC
ncbi:ribonuclease domain-containing protein [Kitasatospora sp. NPDC096147]|uniref:ribonuclease domain-containing protein n=1 Tax=Kitasatospora sp. NPDC096147 TaxID=3364093 RepID=UPI0038109D86